MKICIPTNGNSGLEEKEFSHFGSAAFFALYDTESQQVEIVENKSQHHAHGACQPLQSLADHKIDVLLATGIGRHAVQNLNDGGIKVYALKGDSIQDVIRNYKENQLVEITPLTACGGHGHDHGHE